MHKNEELNKDTNGMSTPSEMTILAAEKRARETRMWWQLTCIAAGHLTLLEMSL